MKDGDKKKKKAARENPLVIRAESNLLRMPLFALSTKGLSSLDGFKCSGDREWKADGKRHAFTIQTTRNTAYHYPGPLSRTVHFAFLDMLTEAGPPYVNPLTWTWYDVCDRMEVGSSGMMIERLKEAVLCTMGLLIKSTDAIYSKATGKAIQLEGSPEVHLTLYVRVIFDGGELAPNVYAQENMLWFSEWYLDNLNRLFSTPLNYTLWRKLDAASSVASRLYEWLLLRFCRNVPYLQVNYPTLANTLPVKVERYRSDAKKQLEPALRLLHEAGVISKVEWATRSKEVAQLRIYRGPVLGFALLRGQGAAEPETEAVETPADVASLEITELRRSCAPEDKVITEFYKLLNGGNVLAPTKKEVEQARALVEQYGLTRCLSIMRELVKTSREKWSDVKRFAGALAYLSEAVSEFERKEREAERKKAVKEEERAKRVEERREELQQERRKALWQALPEEEKNKLREKMKKKSPWIANMAALVDQSCINEMK